MNDKNVTHINDAKKSNKGSESSADDKAAEELREYLSNPATEPQSLASGDMDKIIKGIDEDEEDK